MVTKKYWKEQYDLTIKSHHKFNTKGHSLKVFLSLEDEHKNNLLNYYKKQSLLESAEDDDIFFKMDLLMIPCPDSELCNFLQS